MPLSDMQRKYLVQDQIIGAAIVNLLLNAMFAWLGFHHQTSVPMTGDPSIVRDTIATCVLLPLLSCLIVTPLVRKALREGKVEPLTDPSRELAMVLWLPSSSFARGLVLALGSLVWFAPVLLGALLLGHVESMSVGAFVLVKALFAAAMGAVVCVVCALYVLATPDPAHSAEGSQPAA